MLRPSTRARTETSGFFHIGGEDDALAGGKARGFEDGRGLACFHVADGLLEFGKDAGVACGDRGASHELLGPGFVGFEDGAVGLWAEDEAGVGGEGVCEALGEGGLGADDDEGDFVLVAVLAEAVDLGLGNGHIDGFGKLGQARVLRVCGVQVAEFGGCREGLCDGVLASPAADEKDVDFGLGVGFGHHGAMVGRGVGMGAG